MEGVIQLSDSISGSHTHITHIYEYTGKKGLTFCDLFYQSELFWQKILDTFINKMKT